MKIGQFSDSFLPIIDGVGRVVYNYCDTLARKGEECTAVVPLDKFGYRGRFPFEIIDYYAKKIPKISSYDAGVPNFDLHFNARMDMTDFDIAHVHTPFIAGMSGVRYAKERNIPLVGTFHSKYYDDFYQLSGSRLIAELGTDVVVSFYNHCDEVWAVSQSSADTLRSYGYKGPMRVMPNGIVIKEYDPSLGAKAKEYFGLNDDPCLLYVGQINWKKNILKILEAARMLKDEGMAFNLVLAGKGPHEQEVKDEAKKLGIADITHLVGHILDEDLLAGLYMHAELFVFPSLYDTNGIVVREAALTGTPSVVVRGSSAAEGIEDGIDGFYCEDDAASIYAVCKAALSDLEHTRYLGHMARELIPQSWDDIMDDVLVRYQYLIDRHKGQDIML